MQKNFVASREEAKRVLEHDGCLHYGAWSFYGTVWTCGGGCCEGGGDSIDDNLDTLEQFCGGDWHEVEGDE